MHTFARCDPEENGESEVSEAAMTAEPASWASAADQPALPGSVGNWRWLMSAAEMAAEVTGVWPIACASGSPYWQGYPRVATRTPGAGTDSVRVARDFTATTLRRWGVSDRDDEIVIVVSELLTNALRHTVPCPGAAWPRWPVRLGLLQPGPWILCAVSDPSDEVPAPREPADFDETGRGLHVVESLADQWGCTAPTARGKVVWATFATHPRW